MSTGMDINSSQSVGVLESTLPVVEAARHVWVDERALEALADRWAEEKVTAPPWNEEVHWSDGTLANTAGAVLLLDTWNFCFWPDPGETKWGIDYQGRALNGYMALAASIKRAIEGGDPLYRPERMAELSAQDLEQIFAGRGRIPMLEERLANAHQVGKKLVADWGGEFTNLLEAAQKSAVSLTHLIVENFPCFDDCSVYYGREVRFYKRAQILVLDLFGSLKSHELLNFEDASKLTAFADYKIPQVLEAHGVLRYNPELASSLVNYEQIPEGDPLEVEIRACMVWAVEKLRRALQTRGVNVAAYELDWLLWNLGQQPVDNEKPYHRTRTIFY